MKSSVVIRLARSVDASVISLLGTVTFEETFGHLFRDKKDLEDYLVHTFSVSKIEGSLKKAENVYWLAEVDSRPVGYAKLKLNSASEFLGEEATCQLQKIYVLRDFLSMKIGLGLQEELLAKARELNYKKIWLSVLKENTRAIRFYEKNGFKFLGDHNFVIGKEHFNFIAMSKSLS